MRVSREKFLHALELCTPGLAPREVIEQSSSFCFKRGKVVTFNGEIACEYESPLGKSFTGAVPATTLMGILRELPDDTIEVTHTEKELVLIGKKARRAEVTMDAKITLPLGALEKPTEWKKLPKKFTDAVQLVQECAGTDDGKFYLTCVHITPNCIESFDDKQYARYKLKTPIEQDFLIRQLALQHIVPLGMTRFSETVNWVHFRNQAGMILSCMRYMEEYPDLSQIPLAAGQQVSLPKGIVEAAKRSEVFTRDNPEENQIKVTIQPGSVSVRGIGQYGKYSEVKPVKYAGPRLSFMISPKMMIELVQRYNNCEVSEKRLKAGDERFVYVASLASDDETKKKKEKKSVKKAPATNGKKKVKRKTAA